MNEAIKESKQASQLQSESLSAEEFLNSIDDSVKVFEKEESARLEIENSSEAQWFDRVPTTFTREQRAHTTILHAGLTMAHDLFIQSAFRGLGYKVQAMDVPDNRALQFGREFGNRGQCNPTYFTVGNLVKKLKSMEKSGLSKAEIIKNYLFVTAGSCGPCRFGTYVTEYRKALRDAGFEGFRVLLFQQAGGMKQATGDELGIKFDATFFFSMSKAVILGDVLNALMYRIRPYEINEGETDEVLSEAKRKIALAFETRKGLLRALWWTRKSLTAIKVDRTRVKPKVAIIGEFWAMTTEGDGNYKMHRFLEKEGAEVDIQLVVNWALYLLWGARYDTKVRAKLKGTDTHLSADKNKGSKFALQNVHVGKKLLTINIAEKILRGLFAFYSKVLGLRGYHLPDMQHIAEISHAFYDNNLRGGEGHMEVGKLIHNVVDQKVNMTLSIKPFGCMPSSAVSDGVQSLITELYPAAIFLPIETNGDGAVNVYSRVQMQLFKARQAAEREVGDLLSHLNWSAETFSAKVARVPALQSATHYSSHKGANTSVDLIYELERRECSFFKRIFVHIFSVFTLTRRQKEAETLKHVRAAVLKSNTEKAVATEESIVKIVEPA